VPAEYRHGLLEVAKVPQANSLVGGGSSKEESLGRVEGDAVDVLGVGVLPDVSGLVGISEIPNADHLVIADTPYQVGLLSVPGDILYDISVSLEGRGGAGNLGSLLDIPEAYALVLSAGDELEGSKERRVEAC